MRVASERPDLRIVGLDLSREILGGAERRAREAGVAGRVEFIHGTALDLPFEANSFDHVYSLGSLKHWGEPRRGLTECLRVLKPSGRLLVTEADRGCRYEDATRWAADTRLIRPLQPLLVAYFRTIVTGQSIDLDDARELWSELPLVDKEGLDAFRERRRW